MASVIKIKRSAVSGQAPTNAKLADGEFAINTADGIVYSANSTTVFEVGANLNSLQVNGQFFPSEDGTSGKVLSTHGNGSMYWASTSASTNIQTFKRFSFLATENQTNFAGNDVDSQSLDYTVGSGLTVYINGILLEDTQDYSAPNSANVILTSGATANDVVDIFAYNVGSANNITIASNNNVGIGNTNPTTALAVGGEAYISANVKFGDDILDASNRVFKVYYANGDIAWG